MTLSAVDVYHHTHAASVVLIVTLVESFVLRLKFAMCHIILTFCVNLHEFGCKGMSFCNLSQTFAYFSQVKI